MQRMSQSMSFKEDNEISIHNNEKKGPYSENVEQNSSSVLANRISSFVFAAIIALGGFTLGWDVGTIGYMVSTNEYQQVLGEEVAPGIKTIRSYMLGIIISSFNLGCLLGCMGLTRLGGIIGFKGTLLVANFIYICGSFLQILGFKVFPSVAIMIIGRFICGITCGTACVITPRYINQLIPVTEKSMYLSLFQTIVCIAILAGNVTNIFTNNNFMCIWITQVGYAVVTIGLITILPESPNFLISSGASNLKIKYSLSKLYINPSEIELEKELERLHEPEIITVEPDRKVYIKNAIVSCVVMALQQLTGINYFFYYGSILFSSMGIDPLLVNLAMSLVNLSGSLASNVIVARVAKQKLLMIGSTIMTQLLLLYMIFGYLKNPNLLIAMVTFACIFIFTFAATWGPTPGIIVARISQNDNTIIGLATCSSYVFNCMIAVITPIMINMVLFAYLSLFIMSLLLLIFLLIFYKNLI